MNTTERKPAEAAEPGAHGGAAARAAEPAAGAAEAALSAGADPAEGEAAGGGRARLVGRVVPGGVRRNPRRAAAVAAIVALLLTGGGFALAAQQLKDPGAQHNHALTDTEATSRLTGEVSDALSRIFAYTPADTRSTAQAAHDTLEGAAARQYQQLFAQIRDQVAAQQLTLSTRVVRCAVVSLTGDRARLLVFLDQTAQRSGAAATSAAAQLSVAAHQVDGRWRISELKAR